MKPLISQPDFEALVRRAGLTLTPQQIEGLMPGWAHVEQMLARIRTHGRDRAAEPAHIFNPAEFFAGEN